jgi:pimeloyl-ACP methyl ester carboxylesterase
MTNPFYFGTSDRRLFGIYEPAAFGSTGKRAAILCYPWGPEYLHAHRTMRQLALKLSASGFYTLRFDYFGTGDSGGDATDTDLKGWETDIAMAVEEIKDIVGAKRITLIGLRLGASVAACHAARRSSRIDTLVLWDPVVSGEAYLTQLGARSNAKQPPEVLGFPLPENMVRDLLALELNTSILKDLPRYLMLVTERTPPYASLVPLTAWTGATESSSAIEFMADFCPWIENSVITGMVPFAIIQRIVAWLE